MCHEKSLKMNSQHIGQTKKYKRTNNDLPNIHIKLNIEGVNSDAAED